MEILSKKYSFFKYYVISHTIFLFLIVHSAQAQHYKIIKQIPVEGTRAISIDKKNMLYIGDSQGDIKRYNTNGELQQVFSPSKIGNISLIEAWTSLRILVFYEDYQEYLILDRFLNQTSSYTFEPAFVGFAKTMSLALDNRLWVFDNTDFSLKKYDPISKTNLLVTPLDLLLDPISHNINFIREYQNLLFVNDKHSGILLFDNLGNYKKTLAYPGLDYISVTQDEICFLYTGRLYFYNVYEDQERYINLPLDQTWLFAGTLGEYYFAVSENKIFIFKEIE